MDTSDGPGWGTAREAVVGAPVLWCCVASGLARDQVTRLIEDLVPVLFLHRRSVG